jgi:hypothetical protein
MKKVLLIVVLLISLGFPGCWWYDHGYDRDRHDQDRGHDYERHDRENHEHAQDQENY